MSTQVERAHGLEALGIVRSGRVHWNLSPAVLYEIAVRRNEAILASAGPLVARTGQPLRALIRDKEPLFAELNLADAGEATLFAAVAAHPVLLNRPIVVTEKGGRRLGKRPHEIAVTKD